MRVKVAVLVSGGGTNLQALLDANLQHGEIAFVLSNRKAAYALERARARGVETAVLSIVMEPDPVRRDEKPHGQMHGTAAYFPVRSRIV